MKRRDFLKSVTGVAAGAMVPAPAIWSAAKADARSETLLIVSEGGPNNLEVHGIGTNVPGYEVSWNCHDRLISHEMKSGVIVMRTGRIVEQGPSERVLGDPQDAYTRELLTAIPHPPLSA